MSQQPHIFFDMDGTLIGSLGVYREVCATFALNKGLAYDHVKMSAGYTNPGAIDMGWQIPLHEQPAMYAEMVQYHVDQMMTANRFLPAAYDGVHDMLGTLEMMGYGMSIVTANTRPVSEVFLQKNTIHTHFSDMRTLTCAQEQGYRVKPSPEALFRASKEKNINLNYAMVIGDSPHDIMMARDAGIPCIAVAWGGSTVEKLAEFQPAAIVSHVKDLPKAISNLVPC